MALTKLVDGVRVTLDPTEEAEVQASWADYEANEKPVKAARQAFRSVIGNTVGFDLEEINILLAVYDEVKRYRIDNTAQTPLIDAVQTVFPGQTKSQIGTTIESRVESYLVASATALAQKIKDTP